MLLYEAASVSGKAEEGYNSVGQAALSVLTGNDMRRKMTGPEDVDKKQVSVRKPQVTLPRSFRKRLTYPTTKHSSSAFQSTVTLGQYSGLDTASVTTDSILTNRICK